MQPVGVAAPPYIFDGLWYPAESFAEGLAPAILCTAVASYDSTALKFGAAVPHLEVDGGDDVAIGWVVVVEKRFLRAFGRSCHDTTLLGVVMPTIR